MHLEVDWSLMKEIQKLYLNGHYSLPAPKNPEIIDIDKISIGRNHRYLTVVLDPETGIVVFVGDGKGAEALLPFRKRLKCSRAKIQAMPMDMSRFYIFYVSMHFHNAATVFDHFRPTRGTSGTKDSRWSTFKP